MEELFGDIFGTLQIAIAILVTTGVVALLVVGSYDFITRRRGR